MKILEVKFPSNVFEKNPTNIFVSDGFPPRKSYFEGFLKKNLVTAVGHDD